MRTRCSSSPNFSSFSDYFFSLSSHATTRPGTLWSQSSCPRSVCSLIYAARPGSLNLYCRRGNGPYHPHLNLRCLWRRSVMPRYPRHSSASSVLTAQSVSLFHGPPETGETVLAYTFPSHVLTVVCTGCTASLQLA
jgi:hypothetical protein